MAQVIEFYIPACFKPKVKWVPQEQRGKVIALAIAGGSRANSKEFRLKQDGLEVEPPGWFLGGNVRIADQPLGTRKY
jgi:hypothetical protein